MVVWGGRSGGDDGSIGNGEREVGGGIVLWGDIGGGGDAKVGGGSEGRCDSGLVMVLRVIAKEG